MRFEGILMTAAAACFFAAGTLRADDRTMRPGQYEMTTHMQMEGMNRDIPPTTFRHCFTAEDVKDAKRIAQGNQQKNSDCEISNVKTEGSRSSWAMTCKSGAKGTAEMTYSAEGYEMTMNMETPGGAHGPMKMKMHTNAKRIGDCAK